MSLLARAAGLALSASLVLMIPPVASGARKGPAALQRPGAGAPQKPQDRPKPAAVPRRPAPPPHPVHRAPAPTIRGRVFIGGYFYDPFFGPYPWWTRPAYPYWYYPIYDTRAELRIRVTPEAGEDAAVYVDGFYAGVVDDFDGVFQSLPLPPGGHAIVLYLQGYRTVRYNLYLQPGSSFTLRASLLRLPPNERSEPPELSPPVPAPPAGSYQQPPTSSSFSAPSQAPAPHAVGYGTLDLYVQPESAQVMIDGQPWVSSDRGHFVVQVAAGRHRLEISRPGYGTYAADVEVGEGEETPLNVSLSRTP